MYNNNNINNNMNSKVRVVARVNSQSDIGAYEVNYLERMIFSLKVIYFVIFKIKVKDDNKTIDVFNPKDSKNPKTFLFSRIYQGQTIDIFNDEIKMVLENQASHCFVTYGPTNSGKTYTIWGYNFNFKSKSIRGR